MVTPVEPDGRGGVREVPAGRPAGAGGGSRMWQAARSVDRSADRAAKATIRRAASADRYVLGAAWGAGRWLAGEAVRRFRSGPSLGDALGGPGGSGGSSEGGFFGAWSNPPEWMRVGDPTRWRQRQWFTETLANTAGAVWSSVWRRGA